ncbi:hypothetical protein CYMTET_49635 [Cymbomonas tetramitiformis]|uniref:Centrosomal protein of 44 kDa n=1 Tax=Cymbomonas tetramitiformis TaxID=36881 RepID=A0AAE0BPW4_9CHLO|nr:hypothetical protein CYMTET_49635 [Cymbomonas tetramitiformis]
MASTHWTGDLEGNVSRLRRELDRIRYPHELNAFGAREGDPTALLPLLHYVLLGFSKHVARFLADSGYELLAKADLRFVECVNKLLRMEFNYRPTLTPQQFLAPQSFAERKILFLHDVIEICKRKHNELVRERKNSMKTTKDKTSVFRRLAEGSALPKKVVPEMNTEASAKEVRVEVVHGEQLSSRVTRSRRTGMDRDGALLHQDSESENLYPPLADDLLGDENAPPSPSANKTRAQYLGNANLALPPASTQQEHLPAHPDNQGDDGEAAGPAVPYPEAHPAATVSGSPCVGFEQACPDELGTPCEPQLHADFVAYMNTPASPSAARTNEGPSVGDWSVMDHNPMYGAANTPPRPSTNGMPFRELSAAHLEQPQKETAPWPVTQASLPPSLVLAATPTAAAPLQATSAAGEGSDSRALWESVKALQARADEAEAARDHLQKVAQEQAAKLVILETRLKFMEGMKENLNTADSATPKTAASITSSVRQALLVQDFGNIMPASQGSGVHFRACRGGATSEAPSSIVRPLPQPSPSETCEPVSSVQEGPRCVRRELLPPKEEAVAVTASKVLPGGSDDLKSFMEGIFCRNEDTLKLLDESASCTALT